MAEIIYFGTNGCSGHYPIGIDKTLTGAEYEIWRECDNETWINNIRKNPGRHLIKHHGEVYTNYGVPFSVDDERGGSHTELFWKGIHTEEEIINLIKNDMVSGTTFIHSVIEISKEDYDAYNDRITKINEKEG